MNFRISPHHPVLIFIIEQFHSWESARTKLMHSEKGSEENLRSCCSRPKADDLGPKLKFKYCNLTPHIHLHATSSNAVITSHSTSFFFICLRSSFAFSVLDWPAMSSLTNISDDMGAGGLLSQTWEITWQQQGKPNHLFTCSDSITVNYE